MGFNLGFKGLKHSVHYLHLLEPFNASLSSLITRTEMVVKTLVYLHFTYLTQLLPWERLIEQFNMVP